MRRIRFCLGFGRTAKAVTAGVALVLLLALGLFAVSPSLHQRVHADTGHADHLCAVCVFAAGQMNWTAAAPVAALISLFVIYTALPKESPLVSLFNHYYSSNRAPPRA